MDDLKSQILELLGGGMSTHDIAQQLGVSWQTVAGYKGAFPTGAVDAAAVAEATDARNLKFGLERDMQDALRRHIDQLDPHLRIVDDGKERQVEAGFIDILAEDRTGSLVVIELKSGDAPDSAVTQLLSYIGSLTSETDQPVRGILVARGFSPRVRLAARAAGIQLVEYGYSFTFSTVATDASAVVPRAPGP